MDETLRSRRRVEGVDGELREPIHFQPQSQNRIKQEDGDGAQRKVMNWRTKLIIDVLTWADIWFVPIILIMALVYITFNWMEGSNVNFALAFK